jgi:molybdopterin-guanine dinucleotide biosynthesis protein
MHRPKIIAVGGFSSDVGKTTLMCQLLRAFPGWEAIKTTRGHYRSCGKDPHACCVSDLLESEAVLRSGREATYERGKDTGRYWEAGAANVHWMIATDGQLERGIKEALSLVRSEGVFIEGNSFTEFIDVDAFIIAARESMLRIKSSARRALHKASALYIWRDTDGTKQLQEVFSNWIERTGYEAGFERLPVYTRENFPCLVSDLRSIRTHSVL